QILVDGLRSPLASLPGPWHSRFTRLPLKYHILAGQRMYYQHRLHEKYGPIVRIGPEEVAVADLEAFSQIHRIGSGFNKAPWYDSTVIGLPGQDRPEYGVFNMQDPKAHAQRRRLFARPFSNTALRKNWEDAVRVTVELAVSKIKADAEGGVADVMKWWTLMATDVIAHLSFGESFDMVGLGQQTPYITALQSALLGAGIRDELPWLYAIARWIPVERIQQVMWADEIIFEHGGKAVTNLRQNRGSQNLFSQMLAESESQEKQSLSDLSVRLEASNLIVAGSDTTAMTLTYLVWAVLKRPDLQSRVEEEVAKLNSAFGDAELEGLPLLNAVIDETLRLYCAVPGSLPRAVPKGGATLGGHFIPADTVVCTQAYTFHRDENVFPDPFRFDETRFMQPQTAAQKLAFHPMGAGSRACLGNHLARMELRLAAALFFRGCRGAKLSYDMDDSVMEMDNQFLMAPRGHRCDITLRSDLSAEGVLFK
ncbi:cytochrome P450, partial [Xylariales sp. AK1849]